MNHVTVEIIRDYIDVFQFNIGYFVLMYQKNIPTLFAFYFEGWTGFEKRGNRSHVLNRTTINLF